MYLLDTNVVSELRRPRPDPSVVRWIEAAPADRLFMSAVTVGQIQAIENIRGRDAGKARELEAWLDDVIASYGVLPMDADRSANGHGSSIATHGRFSRTP